jgi:hypothetical protein
MPADHETFSLAGAITTAAIAALGWCAVYILTGWREDRTKRLQLELEHASSQAKEFYAPLVALTDQLNSLAVVFDEVSEGKSGEERHKLESLFYARFFLPIHEQINEILKTKVHLLEGATVPVSFTEYFEHYATQKAYWNLKGDGLEVSNIKVPGYPSAFYWDVRQGYEAVLQRYEDTLEELRQRRWLFDFDERISSYSQSLTQKLQARRGPKHTTESEPPPPPG